MRTIKSWTNGNRRASDMDPVVLIFVGVVAVAAIVLVASNIGAYYETFTRPTLTILSSAGLAEGYPFEIANATPVSFELQLVKPQSNSAQYSLIVYISNGTDSQAEQAGPIGERLALIGLPTAPGNVTLPVSLTLYYTASGSTLKAYSAVINGETYTLNLTLPYRVVGLFFQLASGGEGARPLTYAWVSLWLNVETPS
jgi:uncharacterized membrane protein